MKKINFILTLVLAGFTSFAQVSLPAFWDCSGIFPTDWTYTNPNMSNTVYNGSAACDANGAPSLRFDFNNDALTVFFGSQIGQLQYQIGGSAGAGTSDWQGTFVIQESANGIDFTTFKNYNTGDLVSNSCYAETANPNNGTSRYIRFFYQNKVSGYNLKMDDIGFDFPNVTTPKIIVSQTPGNNAIFNGGLTQPFSNDVTFSIQNIGSQDNLVISNIAFTGSNASDFSAATNTFPITILPGQNSNVVINFTPGAAGTRIANALISNNDPDDGQFNFTLYGVNGSVSNAPANNTAGVTFSVNKTYRLISSFATQTAQLDPWGGYLILLDKGTSGTNAPVNGVSYRRGQGIGTSKVIFAGRPSGASLIVSPRGIEANTSYFVKIYTYNGTGTYTSYSASAVTANATTPTTQAAASEYATISTSSATFPADLKAVINPHTAIFYNNYASTMINQFSSRDTVNTVGANTFNNYIECSYSGFKAYYNTFDFTGLDFSREHTFPHSWMPSFPADNPEKPEYNDQHNLYPTKQTNVNDARCNYPFGEVVTVQQFFLDGKLGLDASGNKVYEPRNIHKGRAARTLMYMSTCYNGTTGNFNFQRPIGLQCLQTPINYGQDQNMMKKWHFQFPPSNYDMSRNDYLDSLQTNRNPFVDNADYACYIDFTNMSHIASPSNPCYTLSVEQNILKSFSLYPNPTANDFSLSFQLDKAEKLNVEIIDLTGKVILKQQLNSNAGINTHQLSLGQLSNGIYAVRVYNNSINSVRLVEKF